MLKSTLFIGAAIVAGPAVAHPKLVRTTPAANAEVAAPSSISLIFNERIVPRFCGATVVATLGATAARPVAGLTIRFGGDGETMTLASKHRLGRGSYAVAWYVVAADTHRVAGRFTFRVR